MTGTALKQELRGSASLSSMAHALTAALFERPAVAELRDIQNPCVGYQSLTW
jgi:hypothetical protein